MLTVKIELEVEVPRMLFEVCIERFSPPHIIPNLAYELHVTKKAEAALLTELLKHPAFKKLWDEKMAESERLQRKSEREKARNTTAPESG